MAKKMGRPKLPAKKLRKNRVVARLTDCERAKLEKAAQKHGLTLGEMIALAWRLEG